MLHAEKLHPNFKKCSLSLKAQFLERQAMLSTSQKSALCLCQHISFLPSRTTLSSLKDHFKTNLNVKMYKSAFKADNHSITLLLTVSGYQVTNHLQ